MASSFGRTSIATMAYDAIREEWAPPDTVKTSSKITIPSSEWRSLQKKKSFIVPNQVVSLAYAKIREFKSGFDWPEDTWIELEYKGKYYDLNLYDDYNFDETPVKAAAIYRVFFNNNTGYRETDTSTYKRLNV